MNVNKAKKLIKQKLSYDFKDISLLRDALTHSSRGSAHNEILEFLGDSILNMIITEIVFDQGRKGGKREGSLTRKKAMVVDNRNLSNTIKILGLEGLLIVAKGQRVTSSMKADLFEALVGSIYLDSGRKIQVVKGIIKKIYFKHWNHLNFIDYKSSVQEITQKIYKEVPRYKTLPTDKKGEFLVGLYLKDELKAKAKGRSKKEAEQRAAKKVYLSLKKSQSN